MDHRLSAWLLRLGILSLIVGVGLGIWMGSQQDFTLRPVHAHINLIGWTSLTLMGLFYRALPHAAQGRLPWIQFALMLVGFLLMMPSLALVLLGQVQALPVLIAGEVTTALGILLFAVIVFRGTGARPQPVPV
ncbi:MAG: cbb3-type cytochrome c oxidase subunit I [Alphaproteobacteria bacterium]|nr:cbb3-type cytochrome c oxidase subunit I [Alphaproteobacteria bacterium]MBU1526302.1 cbb3-type cytochrome c oxidase subunit I [Alphaproteobacteria bacterium]MBU2116229.1 cbb3-type cytochrome c oxidase subunit I [Alphaproteobacteria bacterium]MBU2351459.1 cbb3-type cytochrome c oxidase subunit I [Alphaproteobacteria bacterium]MBU2382786.1 cbb3-type cytochrome c oxidase subunit I [Alphaproteobacteria bacterium]